MIRTMSPAPVRRFGVTRGKGAAAASADPGRAVTGAGRGSARPGRAEPRPALSTASRYVSAGSSPPWIHCHKKKAASPARGMAARIAMVLNEPRKLDHYAAFFVSARAATPYSSSAFSRIRSSSFFFALRSFGSRMAWAERSTITSGRIPVSPMALRSGVV